MPSRRRNQVDPLQLRPGDFVVHEQHGVGRFVEMMQRTVGGATREYLVIEYAAEQARPAGRPALRADRPARPGDQVRRRRGAHPQQDGRLRLAQDQGAGPSATSSRSPAELIRLYSARMATKGHAFGPDTPWQRELEDAFAYVETPDQLRQHRRGQGRHGEARSRWTGSSAATSATARPRSPCARRSRRSRTASRSRSSCRRPCWSASTCRPSPSATPSSRSWSRPLSRFQSDKEAKEVIAGLADGTRRPRHRHPPAARPRTIAFKDLGLVVVDEEQRFGVEHKEQLKTTAHRRRRAGHVGHADPAHPRDGGHRHPRDVHSRHAARGAPPGPHLRRRLRREADHRGDPARAAARGPGLLRPQQGELASRGPPPRMRELVPEARIATAHGQMGEHQLEQVVLDFWDKKFDVLVCTTIVETGLDISNANTLIVERSDSPRPQPAAPAARPRRPRPRARLLLLPLPAGEADDRDGARPAARPWPATPTSAPACRSP